VTVDTRCPSTIMSTTYARQLISTFGFYVISASACQLMMQTVATVMVSSWLNYCNSILYGTSSYNIKILQCVQNVLVCTVMMTDKCDHIKLLLTILHWLRITTRIYFRIALLTFKTLTTHQPSYIHDLLQLHCSVVTTTPIHRQQPA